MEGSFLQKFQSIYFPWSMDSALQISHRGEGPDPETSALGSDRHRCLCIGVNARCSYEACPAMKGQKKGILTGKTASSLQGMYDQGSIQGGPTETVSTPPRRANRNCIAHRLNHWAMVTSAWRTVLFYLSHSFFFKLPTIAKTRIVCLSWGFEMRPRIA